MSNISNQIALLGTSADPPTCGHQALLEGLLKLFPKVITWASNNPLKHHGAPLDKRVALLSALVNEINNPALELAQELSSPLTINTLNIASKFWPDKEFIFVVGSDLIGQIPQWVNATRVLSTTQIGVAPREGWPIQENHLKELRELGGDIEILPLEIPGSASSEIRKEPNLEMIPISLQPILLQQNLYGLKT